MKIIEPLAITDSMIGSAAGTVPEGDYAEWAIGTTYAATDKVIVKTGYDVFAEPATVSIFLSCITISPTGDIYIGGVALSPTFIFCRRKGETDFLAVEGSPEIDWTGMCSRPNGDIYACTWTTVGTGQIYKRTGGSGAFASLAQVDLEWHGMCASTNHVYACVYGGDIYKQTNGTGNFAAMTAGNKNWWGMAYDSFSGDVYASVASGDIYVLTDEAGSWTAIADTDRAWRGMCADTLGNIYACVDAGDIYKRTAGVGTFAVTGNTSRDWTGIAYDPTTGDLYAVISATKDLYISRFHAVHKIYESLVGSNLGNYPPSDVLATTPKWLEVSATNKWKVFDQKVTDQMETISPAVYTITPGVAVDSIALLNLSMTSYRVQGTDAAYDSGTVASTANDIVLTNLAGAAANVITVTITNSGGLAKCGEIVLGNYYTIGTVAPEPTVGITDYSTKTQDVFGDYVITERNYSEKLSCKIKIINTSVDAVVTKLALYRATPIVWIGSTTYSCMIIYGFWKDFNVVIGYKTYSWCSLEIEGLT